MGTTTVDARPARGNLALFSARTTDGSTDAFTPADLGLQPGDRFTAYGRGTWDGATLTLQASENGSAWFTAKDYAGNDAALTADGIVHIPIGSLDLQYRWTISSAGASTSLNAGVVR